MTRLRLISDAFSQLKQDDPQTAITLCALRRMVKAGEISTVAVGRKRLVDYDALLAHLGRATNCPSAPESPSDGQIRRIS